jgi:tRNA(Ile)-lysidine synthase
VVWDGRFLVEAMDPDWAVGALGGRIGALSAKERQSLKALPASARGALPVLVGPGGDVRLPRPFGDGPGVAVSLAASRLAGACGLVAREAEIA